MPFDFRLPVWTPSDKCLDIMLASVGGMVTSPCSGENRSQPQISNSLCFLRKMRVQEVDFTDFLRCFPMGGQLSLFLCEASEVVLIDLIKYERREVVFRNVRTLYSGELHDRSCIIVAIRCENYITTCIPGYTEP